MCHNSSGQQKSTAESLSRDVRKSREDTASKRELVYMVGRGRAAVGLSSGTLGADFMGSKS